MSGSSCGVLLVCGAFAAVAPTPLPAQAAERLGDSRRLVRESLEAYRAGDLRSPRSFQVT